MSRTKIWYAHLLQKIIAKIGTLPLILHTLLMTNGLSELRARETRGWKKIYFCKEAERNFVGKKYYHHELEKQLLLPWVSNFSRNKLSQNDSLAENYTSLGLFLKSVFGNFQIKLPIELHSRSLWIINRKSQGGIMSEKC